MAKKAQQPKGVDVVVETSGGVVVAMYSLGARARVMLVDWDDFNDDGRPGFVYPMDGMSQMPADTKQLVEQGLHPGPRREVGPSPS